MASWETPLLRRARADSIVAPLSALGNMDFSPVNTPLSESDRWLSCSFIPAIPRFRELATELPVAYSRTGLRPN